MQLLCCKRRHFSRAGGPSVAILLLPSARIPHPFAYAAARATRKGSMGIVLEERNRIAQECHDTLMAGFSAISWQLEATMNLFSR